MTRSWSENVCSVKLDACSQCVHAAVPVLAMENRSVPFMARA
jgi:hypothetical protein